VNEPAAGPLVVSEANPRCFTVAGGDQAVYLTGSHIWNSFHDGLGPGAACADPPEQNDYGAYLAFLTDHGHNFIRLWRLEHFRAQAEDGAFHLCMRPRPWPRTGPGAARDGKPAFDLSRFDQAYFDRLRDRVAAAGDRGIYVAVMLFDGFALHLTPPPDNLEGHPFHAANNLNGIAIGSIVDYQVLPLDPAVQAVQEAYLRKQGQRTAARRPGRLDLARLRRHRLHRPLVHRPAGRRRRQGGAQRHRPLRPRRRRRPVGVEVVPARPPPDPDGLRDHRRRPSARPLPGGAAARGPGAGPPGHGRHPPPGPAGAAAADGPVRRAQLDRVRPGRPGAGSTWSSSRPGRPSRSA
jgi:hypothetical protein